MHPTRLGPVVSRDPSVLVVGVVACAGVILASTACAKVDCDKLERRLAECGSDPGWASSIGGYCRSQQGRFADGAVVNECLKEPSCDGFVACVTALATVEQQLGGYCCDPYSGARACALVVPEVLGTGCVCFGMSGQGVVCR